MASGSLKVYSPLTLGDRRWKSLEAEVPLRAAEPPSSPESPPFFFLLIYIYFILFIWLLQVAAGRLLGCSIYMGSSSLTRDRTQVPCIGSAESYPLCHQGSPFWIPFLIPSSCCLWICVSFSFAVLRAGSPVIPVPLA